MGRPLYPDQPHRTLNQKKEEPVKEEPVAEPKVETRAIDEVVNNTAILEPEQKRFRIKSLRKKKDK